MISAKKSLGQNFLKDKNISKKIINLINNYKEKNIIEVGPGLGALTDLIYEKKPKNLYLIEKDNSLYKNLLEKNYNKKNNFYIFNNDALKFDFAEINKPKSIIGNLPYNISIKLIINWIKDINQYEEIVLMIQKEVAEKMNYSKTNKMNRLNVLTSICCDYKIEFNVSNNVFIPKPKVFSSVIKIKPKKKINFDFYKLENFTRTIFKKKRKKLSNVLPKEMLIFFKLKKEILNKRAEDLTMDEIFFLFNKYLQF